MRWHQKRKINKQKINIMVGVAAAIVVVAADGGIGSGVLLLLNY